MSRILKFRAFGNYADMGEGMHYDIIHNYNYHHELSGRDGENWGLVECLKWMKVMQFTGLQDLDGTDIYEGDILEAKDAIYHEIGDVAYREGSFWCMGGGGGDFKSYRVIGNIYEDPELLKKPPNT